ncbi:MAG: hypothetical protein QF803_08655 [Gammaproteobacteria bacterium]|jgi:hypothetical protein|nr:hypothetical protein [Gammaproteobacteria bacterium]MDP6695670.1 hypothetical protein [Gammaproteobacteria bacterium]
MKYIICTGWWCPENREEDTREKLLGSDEIRGKDFHELWYQSVDNNTDPEKILIVDSASPVRPNLNRADNRIEFISLNFNAGHATDLKGKYAGCTRCWFLGLEYMMCSDADYFVYVEQDALLHGRKIIEHCISRMAGNYMFGSGEGTPQIVQQSLFIIARPGVRRFIQRYHAIDQTDGEISPETKFYIASSQLPVSFLIFLRMRRKNKLIKKFDNWLYRKFRSYQDLPLGYGRNRPINFQDKYFYFQHGSREELQAYNDMEAGVSGGEGAHAAVAGK